MDFSEWLQSELDKRQWRQADLARSGKIATSMLSRIINRERFPGPDTCRSIARAFGIPPEEVLRQAGLLPKLSEDDAVIYRVSSRMRNMQADRRGRELLPLVEDFVDMLYRRVQEAPNYTTEERPPYKLEEK